MSKGGNGFLEIEPSLSDIRRFLAKVEPSEDKSLCWLWTGGIDQSGYPQFSYLGKTVGARRYALALFRGLVIKNYHVKAANGCKHGKRCVNPAHTDEKCK